MKNFIGIDLGTTNSAICSYDGKETRIWKSPGQNDVTPSAILFARRGNKYLGTRAYDSAPWQPESAALLFKRLMGTSTPIKLPALDLTMTPEECSSEILKLLFGYLPEEMRNDPDTGTVITVPAAFNQMQKDATMQAANMAGIGKIALMQEPVAAVMSVMRSRNTEGMFLIYDLGGGTLDIAIAESLGGRVSLLSNGGIAMCGGRDFDRLIMDNIVKPWLFETFDLPDDFSANPKFETHKRVALWVTEKAKIELSAKEETTIFLSEDEMRCKDLAGNDIYLEIPFSREQLNKLIDEKINESLDAARETLSKAGLTPHDLERIVFVGGPTNYKPLRDKVAFELGIPGSTEVNPMTAVAEGASLFAESIDWSSQYRSRKNSRGKITSGGAMSLSFNYISRTPDVRAKIIAQISGNVKAGSEFQIDSIETGWTSGRLPLNHGNTVEVMLPNKGDNTFKVFVFDSKGGSLPLDQDKIVITRTAATVDAIPASHSIFIEALSKIGGRSEPIYLVKSGDHLPQKGKVLFKAAESLKAGAIGSLNFKVWQGDIDDPITDNLFIGTMKINGNDFDDGVIPAGADLECNYQILDSGCIVLDVSIPCVCVNSGKNFYSRQEGQLDFSSAAALVSEEGERTLNRVEEIQAVIDDPKLDQARRKLDLAISLEPDESESEKSQEAMAKVSEAKGLIAQVRKEHLKAIRQIELDGVTSFFDSHLRDLARPSEVSAFDNLAKTAQSSIGRPDTDFEYHLSDLKGKNFDILWRQDWFVVERFKFLSNAPHLFSDKHLYTELITLGTQYMQSDDIEKLRPIVGQLSQMRIVSGTDNDMYDIANIIKA
ncbi:MAG: Hsp70 family protein [Chlorobium sp.]|nr:MAG: Hsp70 family protein [Chlorobium sp.]